MLFRRLLCLTAAIWMQSVHGQTADDSRSADQPGAEKQAYSISDPGELRQRRNAQYVGVTVHTRMPQQFEMYDPHSEQALDQLKEMGFTQVILDWPNLHKAATDRGLNVVLANWWTENTKQEEIDRAVELARQVHPERLAGFSIMDEPGRNAPDTPFGYYIDTYAKMKPLFAKEFPHTQLEISHWGPMAGWGDEYYEYFSFLYESADVMRIMPYPDLHEAALDDVFFMIQRSHRLMKIANRDLPLVVILQSWILPPKNELPTIDELRVMAYQAMLSGAETLSFFEYNLDVWSKTPDFHDRFGDLMQELTQLSRRFVNAEIETRMSNDGILTSLLHDSTGAQTIIRVNTRRHRVGDLAPLEVHQARVLSTHWLVHDRTGCRQNLRSCCRRSCFRSRKQLQTQCFSD